jgi:uncharacterized protein YuzE
MEVIMSKKQGGVISRSPGACYDIETGIVMITLSGGQVERREEVAPGYIVDFGVDGKALQIEILNSNMPEEVLRLLPPEFLEL